MNIRPACAADAAALAALARSQPAAANWAEAGFAAEIAQPCAAVWCAEEAGTLVGFVALRAAGGVAEILNVAVRPDCVGKGIGFALLEHALAGLKRTGTLQVSLEVARDNAPARALYAKAGLQALGTRREFYGPGRDALIMGKDL